MSREARQKDENFLWHTLVPSAFGKDVCFQASHLQKVGKQLGCCSHVAPCCSYGANAQTWPYPTMLSAASPAFIPISASCILLIFSQKAPTLLWAGNTARSACDSQLPWEQRGGKAGCTQALVMSAPPVPRHCRSRPRRRTAEWELSRRCL